HRHDALSCVSTLTQASEFVNVASAGAGGAGIRDLVVREPGDLGEPLRMLGAVGVQPRERQAVAPRGLDELSRRLGRMRPDDLGTDTVARLKPLPARHKGPE